MLSFRDKDSHMPSRTHSICLVLEVLHQAAQFTPEPDHLEPLDDIDEDALARTPRLLEVGGQLKTHSALMHRRIKSSEK
jgi:hypothetical protein